MYRLKGLQNKYVHGLRLRSNLAKFNSFFRTVGRPNLFQSLGEQIENARSLIL